MQKTCQGISHASIRLGRKLDRPFESGVVMKRAISLGLAAAPHRQDTLPTRVRAKTGNFSLSKK